MKLDADAIRERIQRNTAPAVLEFLPELRLHLVTQETPLWRATDADLERAGLQSPYWAFAWAGGQSLARYVLDNPKLVAGKRVLDFAAGSGLVAIAAMKSGASCARATDIDAFAIEATNLNASLNQVVVEVVLGDIIGDPCADIDVVLAGDVFFERELAQRCMPWFRGLAARGALVLFGDPGRYHLPKGGATRRARYVLPDSPKIDGEGVRHCDVYAVDTP